MSDKKKNTIKGLTHIMKLVQKSSKRPQRKYEPFNHFYIFKWSCEKVMFSQVAVILFGWGSMWPLSMMDWDMGTSVLLTSGGHNWRYETYPPVTVILRSSLYTCSNLFAWGPTPSPHPSHHPLVLTCTGGHLL